MWQDKQRFAVCVLRCLLLTVAGPTFRGCCVFRPVEHSGDRHFQHTPCDEVGQLGDHRGAGSIGAPFDCTPNRFTASKSAIVSTLSGGSLSSSIAIATYLATREDSVETTPPTWIGEYNELMNCRVKDELVSRLIAVNNKLNLLSPDLVHGDEDRAEVQQQRENLYAEIKRHRAKGHEGKPCPAARQV